MINPVKAIIMPRNRGIKDRNALVIERNVPIIKQNIAKMVLNVTSSLSDFLLIFFQCITQCFLYIKLNYPFVRSFIVNILSLPQLPIFLKISHDRGR